MSSTESHIKRCLELAKIGLADAIPNPSVGCVIVYENRIIGEGFTSPYGGSHAEVNAINSVENQSLLAESTLYVSLEPCAHFGKTPPCSHLIIEKNVKRADELLKMKEKFEVRTQRIGQEEKNDSCSIE